MNYTTINPNGREAIIRGAIKAADMVCSSHGVGKKTVAIQKLAFDPNTGTYFPHVAFPSPDGMTIASNIRLSDPDEAIGAGFMTDQSIRTAKEAGDGTTWTMAIAAGILRNFDPNRERRKLISELTHVSEVVIETLSALTKRVESLDELKKVATVSANNDPVLGSLIAELVWEVGEHGTVYVRNGDTHATTTEVKKGYLLRKSLMSDQYMKNRPVDGFTYSAPVVALVDDIVEDFRELEPLVKKYDELYQENVGGRISYKRPLVIFSRGMSQDSINSMVNAYLSHGKPIVVVSVKGIWALDVFEDIAAQTGAEIWSSRKGRPLNKFPKRGYQTDKITDGFGEAEKISFDAEQVALFPRIYESGSPLEAHIAIVSRESFEGDREDLRRERIAKMTKGVGYISIGGSANSEMANIGQLVDDAQEACFSALRHGYLPGGGYALLRACEELPYTYGAVIFKKAVKGAFDNMLVNSGYNWPFWSSSNKYRKPGHVFNMLTGEFEKISETTVFDAAKAVECAVRNAVSVACVIIGVKYSSIWTIK